MKAQIGLAGAAFFFLLGLVTAQTNRCPSNGAPATFPNPTDPHSFIVCENGRPYVQQCPLDLSFDASSLSCVYIPNYQAKFNHNHHP